MSDKPKRDPVAVWYAASSYRSHLRTLTEDEQNQITEILGGEDGFMAYAIARAEEFEAWAAEHIDFDKFPGVYRYWLEEHLAPLALNATQLGVDMTSGDEWCRMVAKLGGLPLKS